MARNLFGGTTIALRPAGAPALVLSQSGGNLEAQVGGFRVFNADGAGANFLGNGSGGLNLTGLTIGAIATNLAQLTVSGILAISTNGSQSVFGDVGNSTTFIRSGSGGIQLQPTNTGNGVSVTLTGSTIQYLGVAGTPGTGLSFFGGNGGLAGNAGGAYTAGGGQGASGSGATAGGDGGAITISTGGGGSGTSSALGGASGALSITTLQGGPDGGFGAGATGSIGIQPGIGRNGTATSNAKDGGTLYLGGNATGGNSGGASSVAGFGGYTNMGTGTGGNGASSQPGGSGGYFNIAVGSGGSGGGAGGGVAGPGGPIDVQSGSGGANTGFGSASGGFIRIRTGQGSNANGSSPGGASGPIYINAYQGGSGSATAAAGDGGFVIIGGGNAGAALGGPGGSGGSLYLAGGIATGSGGNGAIFVGSDGSGGYYDIALGGGSGKVVNVNSILNVAQNIKIDGDGRFSGENTDLIRLTQAANTTTGANLRLRRLKFFADNDGTTAVTVPQVWAADGSSLVLSGIGIKIDAPEIDWAQNGSIYTGGFNLKLGPVDNNVQIYAGINNVTPGFDFITLGSGGSVGANYAARHVHTSSYTASGVDTIGNSIQIVDNTSNSYTGTNTGFHVDVTAGSNTSRSRTAAKFKGDVLLDGTAGGLLRYASGGINAPTFTTRSLGTKILIVDALSGSQVDTAIGLDTGALWMSVPTATNTYSFKWYGGTAQVMRLDADATLFFGLSTPSIKFTGSTSSLIHFGNAGIGAPTHTTRSAGTKMVIYDTLSGSAVDAAIGLEAAYIWHSVASDALGFKWYFDTVAGATLDGANSSGEGAYWSVNPGVKTHANFSKSQSQTATGGVQTTDATQTTAWSKTLQDNTLYWVEATVIGRDVAGTERVMYGRKALVYRQGGGATIQGSVLTVLSDVETIGALTADATFTISGNDVRLSVTGVAATTFNWAATITFQAVSGNT